MKKPDVCFKKQRRACKGLLKENILEINKYPCADV